MTKYRLICPECSAVVMTACAEAAVWELCPACRHYRWDLYDARMADKVESGSSAEAGRSAHAEN